MKIHADCAIIFLNKNPILGIFFIELFTVIFIEVYMFDKTYRPNTQTCMLS